MTPEDFLRSFADEINDLADRRLLAWKHFLDGSWNANSWVHARMFGALVRAVRRPLVPMVEVFWNRQFHPDVCLVDNQDMIIGVVEYESTNSSDERIVAKDLAHFESAILEYKSIAAQLPKWWLVISTLPNRDVKRWPWYDYEICPQTKRSREARNINPLLYHEEWYHDELRQMTARIMHEYEGKCSTQIIWANLDGNTLAIRNVNGQQRSAEGGIPVRLGE
jgi:hypothetical protein